MSTLDFVAQFLCRFKRVGDFGANNLALAYHGSPSRFQFGNLPVELRECQQGINFMYVVGNIRVVIEINQCIKPAAGRYIGVAGDKESADVYAINAEVVRLFFQPRIG